MYFRLSLHQLHALEYGEDVPETSKTLRNLANVLLLISEAAQVLAIFAD